MRFNDEQVEWIVREVIRRLQNGTTPTLQKTSPPTDSTSGEKASQELTLTAKVVATEQLHGRLNNVVRLRVGRAAILTPAVRDLLADRNVELVRDDNLEAQNT